MRKKIYIVYIVSALMMSGCLAYFFNINTVGRSSIIKAAPVKFSDGLLDGNTKVIAHRALCSGEPENSMKAIKSSIKSKVDYAEIDVQETKDGIVVLMHDRNLRRLTGLDKNVDDVNFKDLEKLNISPHRFGFHNDRIPTLDQVVKESRGRLKLIIEIKPFGNTADLTDKVVGIVNNNNFVNQCKIHSISYKILVNVKKLNPKIQTGYIINDHINNLDSLDVDFYSVMDKFVSEQMVSDIHKKNKEIYVWTVNDEPGMRKLIKLNVDGIITDKPHILLDIKKHNTAQKI